MRRQTYRVLIESTKHPHVRESPSADDLRRFVTGARGRNGTLYHATGVELVDAFEGRTLLDVTLCEGALGGGWPPRAAVVVALARRCMRSLLHSLAERAALLFLGFQPLTFHAPPRCCAYEGKNHEVRRLVTAAGYRTLQLQRIRIGPLGGVAASPTAREAVAVLEKDFPTAPSLAAIDRHDLPPLVRELESDDAVKAAAAAAAAARAATPPPPPTGPVTAMAAGMPLGVGEARQLRPAEVELLLRPMTRLLDCRGV